jgi:hypothetical protein
MTSEDFITQQYEPTHSREHGESYTRGYFGIVFIDKSGATFFEEPDYIVLYFFQIPNRSIYR